MFEDLEKELGAMKPREPSAGLEGRIAAGLAREKFSRGDRWLLSVMSAGVAAAVVIVTLVVADGAGSEQPGAVVPGNGASMVADTPRLMAALAQASVRSELVPAATDPNGGG